MGRVSGIKVATAHEMARVEALAYAQGKSPLEDMERAGEGVAKVTEAFIEQHALPKKVTLLAGKGNNGGDSYVAGRYLLKKGFSVKAYSLSPLEESGSLCREMRQRFVDAGGQIFSYNKASESNAFEGVLLDGLVGTGFRGKAEGILAQMIEGANRSTLPILAIDIPSGVCGDTGSVETVAINATLTIYLELPKLGFFIGKGWEHVGSLVLASFGMAQEFLEKIQPVAILPTEQALSVLPQIVRARHKYEAGYILGVAGSPGMAGAAFLSSYAALKAGAGIVRLFHPHKMLPAPSSAPFELILERWNLKNIRRFLEEEKRARAAFIGPGIGRGRQERRMVARLLSQLNLPTVIDADALFALGEDPSIVLPKTSILTPHRGEFEHLTSHFQKNILAPFHVRCQNYVDEKRCLLILKGAPTWIFSSGNLPLILTAGDPGMATAGAGDVLTGMVAAMLAQRLPLLQAAMTAVYMHGRAGEYAAEALTSYCVTASDLIHFLPKVISFMRNKFHFDQRENCQ